MSEVKAGAVATVEHSAASPVSPEHCAESPERASDACAQREGDYGSGNRGYDMTAMSELVWMLTEPSNDDGDVEVIAQEIENMGRYPIKALVKPPPFAGGIGNSAKRALLMSLQPHMEVMKKEKAIEADALFLATGLRAVRTRGSSYAYSGSDGLPVPIGGFEKKYGAFVEARRQERWGIVAQAQPEWFGEDPGAAQMPASVPAAAVLSASSLLASPPSGPSLGSPKEQRQGQQRKTLSPSQIRMWVEREDAAEGDADKAVEEELPDTAHVHPELPANVAVPFALDIEARRAQCASEMAAAEARLFEAWEQAMAR